MAFTPDQTTNTSDSSNSDSSNSGSSNLSGPASAKTIVTPESLESEESSTSWLISFTNEQIADFCRATSDTNIIHNPEEMAKLGRAAIVPGMGLLAYFASEKDIFLIACANNISASFSKPLHANESAQIAYCSQLVWGSKNYNVNSEKRFFLPEKETSIILKMLNQKSYSASRMELDKKLLEQQGSERSFLVTNEELELFDRAINSRESYKDRSCKTTMNFLFAIAYSSQALLKCVEEPITDIEREVGKALNLRLSSEVANPEVLTPEVANPEIEAAARKKCLPVYTFIELFFSDNANQKYVSLDGLLDFRTVIEHERGKRDFKVYLRCCQQRAGVSREIYAGVYCLTAVPEAIIKRTVKKL